MLQSYCISVPCKTYVRKYYTTLFAEDVLTLDMKTDFGDTIVTKMSHAPLYRVNKNMLNLAFRDFSAELKFKLPIDFFYRIQNELTDVQVYNINRYLENCFKADMYLVINCAGHFGVEIRTAIETFARKYHIIIEEDITYEALQKSYYRFKKSTAGKNNFLVNLSTPSYTTSVRA